MAPKRTKQKTPIHPNGMFAGMVVFLVENAVQSRRLQIWKQKLLQMGARLEDSFSGRVSHVFASSRDSLLQILNMEQLGRFTGRILQYQWLEDSLSSGEKVSEDLYEIQVDPEATDSADNCSIEPVKSDDGKPSEIKRRRTSLKSAVKEVEGRNDFETGDNSSEELNQEKGFDSSAGSPNSITDCCEVPSDGNKDVGTLNSSGNYHPPDLNRTITDIFGKLINIYRALGDERRSFSYYKAIPVIEKLPCQIVSVDQVNNLPGIGKSLKDHIHEIITTGKLSKLEHFETNEKSYRFEEYECFSKDNEQKHVESGTLTLAAVEFMFKIDTDIHDDLLLLVKTISLFGEIWGVGPATALKLYEKGHRALEDLNKEESLTNAQNIGLKYFNDIKTRIPRHEVKEMEALVQKVAQEILPGVIIVCGGSYRRGKASCGDMDIIITHPDGQSHRGFLPKLVKHLKEINFLREDLVFSTHSEEGTDSGVDTYFGLCTYPGQELRRRVDFKVYPRDIYAFGLIAWTGNDVLNRRLRLLAESKGFRLDDTGLFPATKGSDHKRGERAKASLKLDTEKEVFEFLGFPCLKPHERNL